MNRKQLERQVQEIDEDYFVEYYRKPLWHGSVEAPAGWYLQSRKRAAQENLGRGKYLGSNLADAADTVACSLI